MKSYTQQKQFLRNNAASMLQRFVDFFTAHYKCIELNSNDESTNGDSILFNVSLYFEHKSMAKYNWGKLTFYIS